MLEVQIDSATDADLNLVRKSWMRSYRKSAAMDWVGNASYDAGMPARIERIIAAPSVRVLMARPPVDPLTAFGFIVASPTTLHYLWTKEAWRKMGVAHQLVHDAFPSAPERLTHLTKMGENLWQLKMAGVLYDPFGVP